LGKPNELLLYNIPVLAKFMKGSGLMIKCTV